jgi:hypothetical protein
VHHIFLVAESANLAELFIILLEYGGINGSYIGVELLELEKSGSSLFFNVVTKKNQPNLRIHCNYFFTKKRCPGSARWRGGTAALTVP